TGEVFIGTDGGLISYRGTATRTEGNPRKEARAFPNPVRPGYEGLINVKGLPQNAIVKITDTRGGLIYQGRATGGQLSWNGYGMNGKRPSSGVLFVFACQEDGSQTLACKIFYIR
ncbi:MAG: Por secretion system protein, partial [Bacteroidales bacterium]|nr:Por secretion system protein [Bacteroidales bacterium]